jgi:DNA-binding NarL/FixJ family response regulator
MNIPRHPFSIVLADDHPVVLHGLAAILRAEPDFTVVATCSDGISALQAIRHHAPDLAVLDIGMPGMTGLNVLSSVVADRPETKVVFLTAAASDGQILTAISRGAKGFMLKDMAADSLIHCVRQVAAGQRWFPTELVDAAVDRETGHQVQRERLQKLTAREREVVVSLCAGHSNKQIARELNVTEGTVRIHLHNIFEKLGVTSRTALTALAIVHRDALR